MDEVEVEEIIQGENNHLISVNTMPICQTNKNQEGQTDSGESTDIQRSNKFMVLKDEMIRAGEIDAAF